MLAIVSLIDAASSGSVNGAFIGLYSFVGLLGLALCFLIGFWPWILVIPGMALIIYFLGKLWHLSTPPLRLLRNQGLWFWIILTFIIISLISGGWRSFNALSFVHSSFNQRQIVEQPINYTVNGQATVVINDINGNVTVVEGQSNTVIIQAVNGNSFPGNPNDIQQSISQNGNSINAEIQNSQDLLVSVPSGTNLSLNTGSGTINVKGVAGQMTLVADDGTINASDDTLSGSSSLTTNSGDINFDGTISAGGNYQFITTSGTVTVALPTSPAFHIDATTNSGSINIPGVQNNSSGTQATGDVGANSSVQGTNVTMKSDNGDINLNQK